jgi:hypothetical protein
MAHCPNSVDRKLSFKNLKTGIEKDFQDNCFHLQVCENEFLWKLMITEENCKIGRAISGPALFVNNSNISLDVRLR